MRQIVGREVELAQICSGFIAEGVRLLTLHGPPGAGKTTLARAAFHRLGSHFPNSPRPVRLAQLGAVAEVPRAIARAFPPASQGGSALPEQGDVLASLPIAGPVLLLLDNCEHLLAARNSREPDIAALIAELLERYPELRILATSRPRLGLGLSKDLRVGGLPVPPPGSAGIGEIAASPAVRCFVTWASSVSPGFALTPANAGSVADLVRRLDGLPHPLRLAAGRLAAGDVADLVADLDALALRISNERDLEAHQASLTDLIAWSYDRLGPSARGLLRRLAALPATFTRSMALCLADGPLPGDDATPEGDFQDLVEQALVERVVDDPEKTPVARMDDPPRFALLETVAAFLRTQSSREEVAASRSRLVGQLIGLAREQRVLLARSGAHDGVLGSVGSEALDALSLLRAADDTGDVLLAARIVVAWWPLFALSDLPLPAVPDGLFAALLRRGERHVSLPPRLRVATLFAFVSVELGYHFNRLLARDLQPEVAGAFQFQWQPCRELVVPLARLLRERGLEEWRALAWMLRGDYALLKGRARQAERHYRRALVAAPGADKQHRAQLRARLALVRFDTGGRKAANASLASATVLWEGLGDVEGQFYARRIGAIFARRDGDDAQVRRIHEAMLKFWIDQLRRERLDVLLVLFIRASLQPRVIFPLLVHLHGWTTAAPQFSFPDEARLPYPNGARPERYPRRAMWKALLDQLCCWLLWLFLALASLHFAIERRIPQRMFESLRQNRLLGKGTGAVLEDRIANPQSDRVRAKYADRIGNFRYAIHAGIFSVLLAESVAESFDATYEILTLAELAPAVPSSRDGGASELPAGLVDEASALAGGVGRGSEMGAANATGPRVREDGTPGNAVARQPEVCQADQVLTRREVEVLQLVAEGLSNKEIGDRLFLSDRTVGEHLRNIFTKLDPTKRTRTGAVSAARERGIIM